MAHDGRGSVGQRISRLAYSTQAAVDRRVYSALQKLEQPAQTPPAQALKTLGLVGLGVAHGNIGMATGVVNGAGGVAQYLTSSKTRSEVCVTLKRFFAHPDRYIRDLEEKAVDFFERHPAYVAGDYATVPMAALAAGGFGPVASALTFVSAGVAALASPNPNIIE